MVKFTSVAMNVTTGTYYSTLAEALAAANAGETVKLVQDCAESMVIITKGVTLDLNGKTLTAQYLVAFNGNYVVDSTKMLGTLVIGKNNVSFASDNMQMPVWTTEGYKFTKINFAAKDKNVSTDSFTIDMAAQFTNNANSMAYFADGATDNGISFIARITWNTNEGVKSQDLVMSEDMVETVYGGEKMTSFRFTVNGVEGIADLKIALCIISDTGVGISKTFRVFNSGVLEPVV